MSNFQLNTKQLFLTYPQCTLSKEDALMLLQARLSEYSIDKYVVAHEHHANGDDHLHCYFKLVEPFRTRDPKALDLREFHGNYQGCRSAKNVVKYCTKAEDYLSNFDIGDCVNGPSATKVAMQQVLDGVPLTDVVAQNPMLLKGYRNLKLDLDCYKEDLVPAKPDLLTTCLTLGHSYYRLSNLLKDAITGSGLQNPTSVRLLNLLNHSVISTVERSIREISAIGMSLDMISFSS